METAINSHLKEARSCWDLGLFNDANRAFASALSEDADNILLVLEAAGCKMSQGLVGDAHTMAAALENRLDKTSPELKPLHVALLDSMSAMTTYVMTAKFKEPIRLSLDCYTQHGLEKPTESYDKHTVSLAPGHVRC